MCYALITSLSTRKKHVLNFLDEWTSVLALYAAIVSTGLLVVEFLKFRTTLERAKISTSSHPSTDTEPGLVGVHVKNKGHTVVTVNRLHFNVPGPHSIPLPSHGVSLKGPELPVRVEPRSTQSWYVEVNDIRTVLRENGWAYEVRGVVTLGSGKQIWESIHRYTSVE